MPTSVAVLSLLNLDVEKRYIIHFLVDESVTDKDRLTLSEMIERKGGRVRFIQIGSQLDKGYAFRGISKASYYRLLIPWLVPEVEKYIYCDGDVIFLQNFYSFYDIDLENFILGGVHTPFYDTERFSDYCKQYELYSESYINAGVLLVNANRMREMFCESQILELVSKKFFYQDQDIINILFKGQIKLLPLSYNFPSYLETITPIQQINLIHYSGPKPWKGFTNRWAYWWSIYSQSPLYDAGFEEKIYKKILIPNYSLKQIFRLLGRNIKRKVN